MFSGCTVPPDSKETELGSSNWEASPSAGKNTKIVSVPCYAWKSVPTAIWGICSNFVECECFLESNLPDVLTQCETNLDDWPEQVFRENILPMFLRFSW